MCNFEVGVHRMGAPTGHHGRVWVDAESGQRIPQPVPRRISAVQVGGKKFLGRGRAAEAGEAERVGLLPEEVDDEQVMIESLTGFP
jgi:hypothetical protein